MRGNMPLSWLCRISKCIDLIEMSKQRSYGVAEFCFPPPTHWWDKTWTSPGWWLITTNTSHRNWRKKDECSDAQFHASLLITAQHKWNCLCFPIPYMKLLFHFNIITSLRSSSTITHLANPPLWPIGSPIWWNTFECIIKRDKI